MNADDRRVRHDHQPPRKLTRAQFAALTPEQRHERRLAVKRALHRRSKARVSALRTKAYKKLTPEKWLEVRVKVRSWSRNNRARLTVMDRTRRKQVRGLVCSSCRVTDSIRPWSSRKDRCAACCARGRDNGMHNCGAALYADGCRSCLFLTLWDMHWVAATAGTLTWREYARVMDAQEASARRAFVRLKGRHTALRSWGMWVEAIESGETVVRYDVRRLQALADARWGADREAS